MQIHRSPLRGSGVVVKYRPYALHPHPVLSLSLARTNSCTSPFLLLHFCPHSALQLHLSIRLFVPVQRSADVAGGFPSRVTFTTFTTFTIADSYSHSLAHISPPPNHHTVHRRWVYSRPVSLPCVVCGHSRTGPRR